MRYIKIFYWVSTLLLCGIFIYSAGMYFTKTEMVEGFFASLNYPTYLVIPLAIAKILAVIAILRNFNRSLTDWAYSGLFFDLILASAAHYNAGHEPGLSFIGIPLLICSYFTLKKAR